MNLFPALDMWAVLLAAATSFIFGGIWYGALSKQWMAAAGLTETQVSGPDGPSPWPFVITFAAQLVMAWTLAGLLLHLAKSGVTANLYSGAATGLFVWLGFIATTLVVSHQFQMQKTALTLIDGGHWLGVMLIQGAIIGWMMAG
jgi:hypothetical protein